MDEGETKTCENCKREIPAVNFTIHALHCARNIGVCPACKEPVPLAELQQHHEKTHKLLPCAQCGERVCGADLEDHVRDSCAHTMRCCRFCSIELRRKELPPHERYCGARTERCDQCGEWVMHKYRQLHVDSNHGFIRLDEDPVPTENAIKTTNVPKPINVPKSSSSTKPSKPDLSLPKSNLNRPLTDIRYFTPSHLSAPSTSKPLNVTDLLNSVTSKPRNAASMGPSTSRDQNINCTFKLLKYVSNDNTSRSHTNGPVTNLPANRQINGPVNLPNSSRLANGPANLAANEGRTVVNSSGGANGASGSHGHNGAVPRVKRTNHQPQVNTSSAAAPDKVNKSLWASRGAVKKRPAPPPPEQRAPGLRAEDRAREHAAYSRTVEQQQQQQEAARHRSSSLRNLQPMSAEQFERRFSQLQLPAPAQAAPHADRFSQIKSSLRELRRGLNEVTAPYNSNANMDSSQNGEVRLPCEFCGAPVLPDDLVLHQTGCRPDLTQYRPAASQSRSHTSSRTSSRHSSRTSSRNSSRASSRASSPSPLIPCEFCAAPLPVHLVSEHQERCGRDAELLLSE